MKLTHAWATMPLSQSGNRFTLIVKQNMMRILARAALLWRVCRVSLHLLQGLALATFCFPRQTALERSERVQAWSAGLLRILRVQLQITGCPADAPGPTMLVANHISWLDVYALNCACPARFVAKSEVRRWPLIGWFARNAGTVFIDRSRPRDILKVNAHVGELLCGGETVAVFPEGTTTRGDTVLPFHAPLLQSAVHSRAWLQTVAIRYARTDGSLCAEADFAGDKTLMSSLALILAQPVIHVRLHFFPALECAGQHRRDLARSAHALVLGVIAKTPQVPQAAPITPAWRSAACHESFMATPKICHHSSE